MNFKAKVLLAISPIAFISASLAGPSDESETIGIDPAKLQSILAEVNASNQTGIEVRYKGFRGERDLPPLVSRSRPHFTQQGSFPFNIIKENWWPRIGSDPAYILSVTEYPTKVYECKYGPNQDYLNIFNLLGLDVSIVSIHTNDIRLTRKFELPAASSDCGTAQVFFNGATRQTTYHLPETEARNWLVRELEKLPAIAR